MTRTHARTPARSHTATPAAMPIPQTMTSRDASVSSSSSAVDDDVRAETPLKEGGALLVAGCAAWSVAGRRSGAAPKDGRTEEVRWSARTRA